MYLYHANDKNDDEYFSIFRWKVSPWSACP